MIEKTEYDVVVVGGGPAGLSGALVLSRSRRRVLVIDAGEPRNAPAGNAHNYLGREGVPPLELLASGRAEVEGYGGEIVTGKAVSARRLEGSSGGFEVELADGTAYRARRLLVTTGLVDELPDVPGLAGRWGRDVLHCPYCHGWEARDQAIGVLSTGPMSVHQALMWRQLSDDVSLFLHTGPEPGDEQYEELAARGIAVVDGEVVGLEVENDRLTGVRLKGGQVVGRRVLVAQGRVVARSSVLDALGLEASEFLMGETSLGEYVPSEPGGATTVPGVWVAGNVTDLMATVIGSAEAGLRAGAMINADLVGEDTRRAVDVHRARETAGPAETPETADMAAERSA